MNSIQAGILLQHIRRAAGTGLAAQPPDGQLLERFTAHREEAAFTALVRRHGPMVLNVCRSVLRHEQDAEDALQATFLVLAKKAYSIRRPEAVAGWLHEVAYRVAVKAQADAARRRAQERRAVPMAAADPTLDMTLRDLRRVLHEELRRLPEKYRLPLVMCYLEGRSHGEAAGVLGWSKGAFRGRLDRGREHLRRRLAGRGVTLAALLCAATVAPRAAAEPLVRSVVRSAVLSGGGGAAAGSVSVRVSSLAEGVIQAMFTSKLKIATALLLAVGLVATGAGALAHQALTAREQPPGREKSDVGRQKPKARGGKRHGHAAAAPAKPGTDAKEAITYGGRVLGPEGRPVAGAKLYLTMAVGYLKRPAPSPVYATSGGPDGRFRFQVPKAKFGDTFTVVAATAAKFGPDWVTVPPGGKTRGLTLRLVKEDMPITGQIVDLEGKPVPGATLRVLQINAAPGEDIGLWLQAVKAKKGVSGDLEQQYMKRFTIALAPKATADAQGRLRLTGIGRNRLIRGQIDGPTIVSKRVHILTRPGPNFRVVKSKGHREYAEADLFTTYYGACFRHVAAPTKPVVGAVRDKDTRKPLAGVRIQSYKFANDPYHGENIIETTTDARGRYRLVGLPKGEGNKIMLVPPDNLPYVAVHAKVPDTPGLDPVTVDFALKRGVWIEGKITDKVTGEPLQASVEYFARYNDANLPNLRDYEGFTGTHYHIVSGKEDGSYRVVGLPGPGLVTVYSRKPHYLRAPERDDEFGTRQDSLSTSPYHISFTSNYWALAPVHPAKGARSVRRDVTLDPGWTFSGTLLGPDGKPLTGARSFGTAAQWWEEKDGLRTAEFTVRGFNPRRPRAIFFHHREKALVGVAPRPRKNGDSITVRMVPGAAAAGRLVGADRSPRAGVELRVAFRPQGGRFWSGYFPDGVKTDRQGRFRVGALLPGYEFRLSDVRPADKPGEVSIGGALHAGKTKDLGDVVIKR
jgi:RNA polymerase sigma factor (sigma-70 family)